MSTTGAVIAAITLTEEELDLYVTHEPTRRWLTGPGLPGGVGPLTFAALRADGLRTVADSTGDPGNRLAPDLRNQLVIGGLLGAQGKERSEGLESLEVPETESILLDGETGEVSTTYFLHDRPDLMDRRTLAPSLETLVRFATVTEELAEVRGQFATYAGRFGPKVVEEASRQLLAVFEEGTGGEVPPFWRSAALIRPLALVAGPGTESGLTLDVPARLLDREFGQGTVARFEDVDFPATLTHEPTRRFLRETGLPERGFLFELDTDVPLPTLAEYYEDEYPGDFPTYELPDRADHLIRLGGLVEANSLVVDGTTGEVLNWNEPEAKLYPLNTDVSTLAFTLWLLHRERAIDGELSGALTGEAYNQLASTMIQVLSAVDATGVSAGFGSGSRSGAGRHYWTEVFQDEAGRVL